MENGKYIPNPNLQCIEVTKGQREVLEWAADAMNDYWADASERAECGDNWFDSVVTQMANNNQFWFIVEDIDVAHDLLYRIEKQRKEMNAEQPESDRINADYRSIDALARKIRAEFKMVSPAGSQPVIEATALGEMRGWTFIYDDPGTILKKDGEIALIQSYRVAEVEMVAFALGWEACQAKAAQIG